MGTNEAGISILSLPVNSWWLKTTERCTATIWGTSKKIWISLFVNSMFWVIYGGAKHLKQHFEGIQLS